MTFKVSPGIANHRYTGCRAYFETHTRSLWVCLHLCLCHTWYLLQTPPTQGKGLISPTFPPLWVCLFSAPGVILRYGLLWYATSFLLSYPLSYLWMIIISDPHSVYLGNLPLKYLWTIFVDNHHHWPWSVVKALVYLGNLPLKVCFSCKVQLPSVELAVVHKHQQRGKLAF